MNVWYTLYSLAEKQWLFFGWRDALQVVLFASIFYHVCRWLKADHRTNLLPQFLAYCCCVFIAHFAHITPLNVVLIWFAPVMLIWFTLLHQDTLQKNYVSLRNMTPVKPNEVDWIELLIRSSLIALNDGKSVCIVIERTHDLATLLSEGLTLNAPITQDLVSMIMHSSVTKTDRLLWVNHHGVMVGANAQVTDSQQDWLTDAILITSKTDALMIRAQATTKTFDVLCDAQTMQALSAADALVAIKNMLKLPSVCGPVCGEIAHEAHHKTASISKRAS